MNPSRNSRFLLALLLLIGVAVGADHLGLFAGIDNSLSDFSFRLRGQRAISEKIAIAAIDEKTLAKYGKWPIDRSVYAALLDATRDADVVGFDIVMSERTATDDVFARAVADHGRVVLPVYLTKSLNIIPPSPSLSPSALGHVHVEQGVDNVTREVFHTLTAGTARIPSLPAAMLTVAAGSTVRQTAQVTQLQEERRIFQHDYRRINFYGPAGTFPHLSIADILAGKAPATFFKGKVLLTGLTAPGIIDEVSTPFSQHRNRMTGVELHANILNNLLDGNHIMEVPNWLRLLAVVLLTLLLWVILPRMNEHVALLLWVASLAAITAVFFLLFAAANQWLNPTLFYSSLTATFLLAHLNRLDRAAIRLDGEHAAISALLGGTARNVAPPKPAGGLPGLLSEGGINLKINRLLLAQQEYSSQLEESVRQRTEQLEEALATIGSMSDEMVLRLAWAVESKDKDTSEHTFRLGLYARVIAARLGLPADFVESIGFASALHDVGKIGISDSILMKTGPLDPAEMEVIKTHCLIGQRILGDSSFPRIRMCASIALNHHERWDGTGYPNGLKGEEIPLEARIISICDCYDSLRSRRPYKEPFDHDTAFHIITEGKERTRPEHFDPTVLQAFKETAGELAEIFNSHQD